MWCKKKSSNDNNKKSSRKSPSPKWKKNIFVIFDLRLLHLFHLIFVGYRWKMKKSIASGRSGSTFQHPYLAFTAVCKSEPFFYNWPPTLYWKSQQVLNCYRFLGCHYFLLDLSWIHFKKLTWILWSLNSQRTHCLCVSPGVFRPF